MIHRHPPEIIDNIIDYVKDKATLSACSLVCRSWAPRSRCHLFRTVKLIASRFELVAQSQPAFCDATYPPEPEFELLDQKPSPMVTFRAFDAFIAFLESYPHLVGLIRELSIDGTRYKGRSKFRIQPPEERVCQILRQLPKLQAVHLHKISVQIFYDNSRTYGDGLPRTPSILEELLDALAPMRNLEELRITDVTFKCKPRQPSQSELIADSATVVSPFSRLKTFEMWLGHVSNVWLPSVLVEFPFPQNTQVSSLRRLEVNVDRSNLKRVGEFLEIFGPNLVHLGLQFWPMGLEPRHQDPTCEPSRSDDRPYTHDAWLC